MISLPRPSDNITYSIGVSNDDDVLFGDIFYLSYCGINVFLKVCRTNKKAVCVYELSKRRLKGHRETISSRASKNPLLVMENNTWTKSNFWVETGIDKNNEKFIKIQMDTNSKLFKKVVELGYVLPPVLIAYWMKEEQEKGIANFYWEDYSYIYKQENNVKQKKIEKIKNSA